MAVLKVSDGFATQLAAAETPAASTLDADLDSAYSEGVQPASSATATVPKLAGYADFSPAIKVVLRQTVGALFAVMFPSWTNVGSFSPTWANAATYETVGYRREGGRIWLKGSISGGTTGTAAFTLPAGFRPPAKVRMGAGGTSAFVEIATTGIVTVTGTGTIGLDGLSFAL